MEKLQNGSDIRGVALEGVEGEPVNLTPEVVETIGRSFVAWLRSTLGAERPVVAVGTDCRLSGPSVKTAFVRGAVAAVCQAVARSGADLGVIFDTDVDRSAIIGQGGEPINRNALIALIASIILEEHPGSTIVTDSVTSDGLAAFIAERGGRHHRFRRGYKNVINEGIRLNALGEECWLAIETSGHAALRENHFLDDGAYLAAKLIGCAAKMKRQGKRIHEVIASLRQPKESKEIRIKLTAPDFKAYGERVLSDLKDKVAKVEGWALVQPNHEGVRVSCSNADEDGWWLLRMSLHDPVMPLNIESNVEGGVAVIERKLRAIGLL